MSSHGMKGTTEHTAWLAMKRRCNNPNNKQYHNYGGRGIKVCKDWNAKFLNFYRDMGPKPEGLTIERIDNNKGYYKENCKWASVEEQMKNRRLSSQVYLDNIQQLIVYFAWLMPKGIG